MKYPMREKYVDELTGGPWFSFGETSSGLVDIANANQDCILPDMPKELAEKVIELHGKFMEDLYKLIALR
jgi:hypothetical protein